MAFATPSAEDHTRPIVIAAKIYAMAINPILFAQTATKSTATIRNAPSYVISLAPPVLRIVPSLVLIVKNVHYYMQCPMIYYHV
jgi:hypothetical protein